MFSGGVNTVTLTTYQPFIMGLTDRNAKTTTDYVKTALLRSIVDRIDGKENHFSTDVISHGKCLSLKSDHWFIKSHDFREAPSPDISNSNNECLKFISVGTTYLAVDGVEIAVQDILCDPILNAHLLSIK